MLLMVDRGQRPGPGSTGCTTHAMVRVHSIHFRQGWSHSDCFIRERMVASFLASSLFTLCAFHAMSRLHYGFCNLRIEGPALGYDWAFNRNIDVA